MLSLLSFKELWHEELLKYFGICCIPLVISLEKVVVEGKSWSCKDCSPHRHIGHCVFVEKCESLPININNWKVEEDLSFFEMIILSKSDTGTNPRRFKFVDDVLFEFIGSEESMNQESFSDLCSIALVNLNEHFLSKNVANDTINQWSKWIKEHFSKLLETLDWFFHLISVLVPLVEFTCVVETQKFGYLKGFFSLRSCVVDTMHMVNCFIQYFEVYFHHFFLLILVCHF